MWGLIYNRYKEIWIFGYYVLKIFRNRKKKNNLKNKKINK